MKKLILIALCAFIFAFALSACSGEKTDITVNISGEEIYVKTHNSLSDTALLDRDYAPEGQPTPVYTAPSDGAVYLCYQKGQETIKDSYSVEKGDRCVIPTNGFSLFVGGGEPSEDFTVSGFDMPEYIDIYGCASVTDPTGITGFILSHKDPADFETVTNALFSPSATNRVSVPDGYFAVTCTRNSKGEFKTNTFDAEKTDGKAFTLMLSEPYAIGFAKACMKEKETYYVNNSDLISPYGTGMVAVIGNTPFGINSLNPETAEEGIYVYDERAGLALSPARDFDFVDVFVFDGVVAYVGDINVRTVLPYPAGYAISFNGKDACEAAKSIKVGDSVETVSFEAVTTPANYVLLDEKRMVETVFHNESRTSFATAVVYDSDFFWDSTRTNVWGVEAAFDKDGNIVSVTEMGVEGVSGNTDIPEGGFVLSSGNSLYASYMLRLEEGSTAKRISKETYYFFRKITDVAYEKTEENKYITVYSGVSKTPAAENALELAVDENGFILSASSGGNTSVPDGGYVISAVGDKKQELTRFYQIGQRVIFKEEISAFYLFGNTDVSVNEYKTRLDNVLGKLEECKEQLALIDYEYAYRLSETAKKSSESALTDPAAFASLKDSVEKLESACVPSLLVQDRAAWVVHYENDVEDVKHIVEYAHSLGINRLILSPYRDSYALYYTEVEHLTRHPDLQADMLKAYIDECHARGMQVYFMYCCFNTQNPSDAYLEEHYVNHFADKLLISKTGRNVAYFYDTPSYTLNPYDKEVRAWNLEIIREVCEKYDVDGIQLDYIRFPLPTYYSADRYEDHGYNDDITAAFMKKYGISFNPKTMPITHELWDEWCKFRCDIVTSFAAEASELVKQYGLTFSCTCFAGGGDREKYVFQDVSAWIEQGIVDEIYPMIYSADLAGHIKYGDEIMGIAGDDCRVILGVGTYDGQNDDVIRAQIGYSYNIGAAGNSIFALEYIQNFNFDSTYKRQLYRDSAVTTDMYGKTVSAYCEQYEFIIEKVYKYLHNADYSAISFAISDIQAKYGEFDPEGKTVREKESYLADVITAFEALKTLVPQDSPVYESFASHVDNTALVFTAQKNILD